MKYGATVRDLAKRGPNWKFYDKNFRMLRQKELIPWDGIHSELWLRASVPKTKQPPPSKSTTKKSGQFFPKGFRWTFHKGGNCTGCDFKHQCFKCGLNHSTALSPNQGCQATTPSPTPLPTPLPTPVKVNRLAIYLTGYENKLQKNLIDGFTFGFRLHL